MSWIQKLYETYDRCAGNEPAGAERLMPICHTTQQTQIEIVIDEDGKFKRASVLDKTQSTTMIPCTEESGGRAGSKPVNHPLCDKLQYVARDFLAYGGEVTSGFSAKPEEPHQTFIDGLRGWAGSESSHSKVASILRYVERGKLISDLVTAGVLPVDGNNKLLKVWSGDKEVTPAIFRAIQATQSPEDAFVRWQVEEPGNPISSTWQDPDFISAWIAHHQSIQTKRGYCMVTGAEASLAVQHPAKLRHAGDQAKLISSNDTSGYTFRGKFFDADDAATVAFDVTQKAHNALRWLIARQGYKNGDQAIVCWAVAGKPVPDPFASTLELLGMVLIASPATTTDTAQSFALRLKATIAGYRATLDPTEDIVVLGLDSATPGRMAINFYRELRGSDFLDRLEQWHAQSAWHQNFGKDSKFIGAPSPRDIAEAAYGRRLDDKLRKATIERLLPCIVDNIKVPRDLVVSCVHRASNRIGFEQHWEWEKCLGIACALFKAHHNERNYQMALEQDRTSRDYLYGRLLALAESIESRALFVAGERRETTAARLMQRFADHPYSTWRTIELSLTPYKTRLRSQRAGFLFGMEKMLDEVMGLFAKDAFAQDQQLSGEFLLGYHCQRQALRPSDASDTETESTDITK